MPNLERWSRTAVVLSAVAALAVAGGCAGYRVGSALPPGIKTVRVPTFANKTAEPQLENETTRATIARFQQDGTLRIAGEGEADAVLEVTLTELVLAPMRYERDSQKTTREFRLTIRATLLFKDARTQKLLLSREAEGEATFVPTGDMTTAKRAAIPVAAKDLATHLVDRVVEYW